MSCYFKVLVVVVLRILFFEQPQSILLAKLRMKQIQTRGVCLLCAFLRFCHVLQELDKNKKLC